MIEKIIQSNFVSEEYFLYVKLKNYFDRRIIQTISYSGPNVGMNFFYEHKNVGFSLKEVLFMFQCHSPKSSPPSPSPTESKGMFYTSVSLLLSRIQGYHYHLSKLHIYAYNII